MKFAQLAEAFERIEDVSSRTEMTSILGQVFQQCSSYEARLIAYLTQGRVAPTFIALEFGIGERLLIDAISQACGVDNAVVESAVRRYGDFGLAAEALADSSSESMTIEEVFSGLLEVARISGDESQQAKVDSIAQMITSMSPCEVRYLVRIPLDRLRLGVGDPTVLDSLSVGRVGDKTDRREIERAYNLVSDLGLIAELYSKGGVARLREIRVEVGNPVRPAQAARLSSGDEIIAKIGECAVEPKFDGFRLQVHRNGQQVRIYSRNLEDMTGMFPEIAEAARTRLRCDNVIFEGEAMAYDPDTLEFRPFQVTVSRRRKHDIDRLSAENPLKLICFDILCLDGEDVTIYSYQERRQKLLEVVKPNESIGVAESIVTDNGSRIDSFFAEEVESGLEGVIAKKLDATYQAGKRGFNWVKLKRSYRVELSDTIDCTVIGYWYGRGKRAQWGIGAILAAVWDPNEGGLKTIARVGTGFSDDEWVAMRQLLDENRSENCPREVESSITPDVWVHPVHVVEVLADELTRSPNHTAGKRDSNSGYALRFPRVLGMPRVDKSPQDSTTVDEIEKMFRSQSTGSAAEAQA